MMKFLLNNFKNSLKKSSVPICMFSIFCCTSPKPELKLSVGDYDFGLLQPDTIYNGSVIVENTGGSTLKIRQVGADCSCTDTFVTKNELLPTDTCLLNFSFNTKAKRGYQNNYIFIEANTDSMVYLLSIHSIVDDSFQTK